MSISAFLLIVLLLLASPADVSLRGQLVPDQEHGFAFKATDGKIYPLFRSITSEALFTDPRLRERELHVIGRMHPEKKGFLDVIQVHSVKNGVLHEVYYWCDICAIRATAPGPCWCCFQPFELKEVPVPTGKSPTARN